MFRFILKRLLMMIPVLVGVTLIVFTIMSLKPGDPVQMYLGDNYSQEAYDAMQSELGLDKPFAVRYLKFLAGTVRGDLGTSYTTGNPVTTEIVKRLPASIILGFSSIIFAATLGVPLGVMSAVYQYSFLDSLSMFLALILVSMPNFWLGLMLIIIFSVRFGIFPFSGFDGLISLVLPAITLGANSLATITRMTRSSMLETIRQDYIRTARAKGVKEHKVVVRHALRNAMIPITTTIGLQFGFSLGGSVMVETVFSWPGIGRLLVDCIKLGDTPVVTSIVLVLAALFAIVNLGTDVLYAYFDPRIKAQYKMEG